MGCYASLTDGANSTEGKVGASGVLDSHVSVRLPQHWVQGESLEEVVFAGCSVGDNIKPCLSNFPFAETKSRFNRLSVVSGA